MLSLRGLICVAGVAAGGHAAMGAGMLHLILVPRDITMFWGETMLIDVYADWSGVSDGLSMAGWKFDVIGHSNGFLTGDVNDEVFDLGVSNGITSGANLIDFAGGQLPPGMGGDYVGNPALLGTLAYTDLRIESGYTVQLGVEDYFRPTGALNVYITASGAQSLPGSGVAGSGHLVILDIQPFDVIFPAPGTALVPIAGLVGLGRRRR